MSQTCQTRTSGRLFDHRVGAGEQCRRNSETKRLGRPEVDHKFVLGRRLHRQVSGLLAFENAIDVSSGAPVNVDYIMAQSSVGSSDTAFNVLGGLPRKRCSRSSSWALSAAACTVRGRRWNVLKPLIAGIWETTHLTRRSCAATSRTCPPE